MLTILTAEPARQAALRAFVDSANELHAPEPKTAGQLIDDLQAMLDEALEPVRAGAELARTGDTHFEVGKTYWDRSACDWDCVFTMTVVRRTDKTLWTEDGKCLRIRQNGNTETVRPFGTYSMCAVMSADRVVK